MAPKNFKDLTGQTFGRLTVLCRGENDKYQKAQWKVKCVCGEERLMPTGTLTSGKSKSCGRGLCVPSFQDLTGKVFGRLTVRGLNPVRGNGGQTRWDVVCSCGTEKTVITASLTSGHIVSCGCYNREQTIKRQTGKKYTEESKARMRAAQKGHFVSEETKIKISQANTGNKFSEEARERMSLARKGRKIPEQNRANMSHPVDLLGKRFGRLVVIEKAKNHRNGKVMWLCKCDCSKIKPILAAQLKNGDTTSCGCLHKEKVSFMFSGDKHPNWNPDRNVVMARRKLAGHMGSLLKRCRIYKTSTERTYTLLGYTPEELRTHLESLFDPSMSWENYGKVDGWSVDHIKPISLFHKEGVSDPKIINALSNLRPLATRENCRKRDKYIVPNNNSAKINEMCYN